MLNFSQVWLWCKSTVDYKVTFGLESDLDHHTEVHLTPTTLSSTLT